MATELRKSSAGAGIAALIISFAVPIGAISAAPTKALHYTAGTGTGMSIDIDADGRSILFDMLGDLYELQRHGGKARRLTSGNAWDTQPRVSPDGKRIAFISDRNGFDNLWIAARDGSGPRMVSRYSDLTAADTPFSMHQPVWLNGGSAIAVRRKALRGAYSADELWVYDAATGKGTRLAGAGQLLGESESPSGFAALPDKARMIVSTIDRSGKDTQASALWVMDRAGTQRLRLRGSDALLHSPAVSRNGHWLAYAATAQDASGFGETELRLCALSAIDAGMACTQDHIVATNLSPMRGASLGWWSWPQIARFTPDGAALLFVRHGRIGQLDLATGKISDLAFSATIDARPVSQNRAATMLDDGNMTVRQLRGLHASEDGALLAFGALGDIWLQRGSAPPAPLPGEDPAPTPGVRYDPVISPDGRRLAYVAWSDESGGSLWSRPVDGGPATRLFASPARLYAPRWSPDGASIALVRDGPPSDRRAAYQQRLLLVSTAGSPARVLGGGAKFDLGQGTYNVAPRLSFSADGRALYLTEQRLPANRGSAEAAAYPRWRLDRIDLANDAVQPVADFYGFGVQAVPSPDRRWLALEHGFNIYLVPMPEMGRDGKIPRIAIAGPARDPALIQITREGGTEPRWSVDGKSLSWSWMNRRFSAPIGGLTGRGRTVKPAVRVVTLSVPRPERIAPLLLKGGRVITMAEIGLARTVGPDGAISATTDQGVLACGDILITGRRIAAIGPCGTISAPAGATTLDVSGKTLMPGLIAMHEHRWFTHIQDRQPLALARLLAHGITTARDPGQGYAGNHLQEAVDAGLVDGPRWFGALVYMFEPDLYPAGEEVTSLADALAVVRKHKAAGATILKDYFKPFRIQRQWLAEAARREGVRLTSDHGFQYDRFVQQALDGYSGFEHAMNCCDVGADVIGLFGRLGVTYDPQLAMDEPIAAAATAWVRDHPRGWWQGGAAADYVLAFKPATWAACRARVARDLLRAGANVVLGTDQELNGLVQHQQLWAFASGGMTNAEILRVGTINGARGIGIDKDLGSLEAGKIADILVLNDDPLKAIFNTVAIDKVVKDGIVHDGETLAVIASGDDR